MGPFFQTILIIVLLAVVIGVALVLNKNRKG